MLSAESDAISFIDNVPRRRLTNCRSCFSRLPNRAKARFVSHSKLLV